MVLIDEEGDYVYATISNSFWDRFRLKIMDGKVHIIKKFEIVPNKTDYRVVSDSKIMIKFFFNTFAKSFEKDDTNIPIHKFDFIHYHNLDHRRENHSILTVHRTGFTTSI
ncbi:hypothetical protein RND81_13G107500 [Saponaria officinalis]|uniref:Replication protein A 70 kDa DNA-binding subunit B/D first OB fold domain-containing protein n=1 Tax=Saponaria officinalis TaxID=3572 RepID=A0AAW1GZE2_SAPOF